MPLAVALRTAPQGGDIDFFDGNGLMYTLNGLGPNGVVAAASRRGAPPAAAPRGARARALHVPLPRGRRPGRRAAAAAKAPEKPKKAHATARGPTADETPTQALFFRPGDLEPQLDIPLRATIPPKTPRPETIPPAESRRIDALTRSNLFLASFQQGQDQNAFLVLDRLPG